MGQSQTKTQSKSSSKIAYPKRYKVVFHNDDFTPMEFVIHLLIEIFNKDINQAKDITLQIHEQGLAVAGIYGFEIAEAKTYEANLISRHNGHPLKITSEEL